MGGQERGEGEAERRNEKHTINIRQARELASSVMLGVGGRRDKFGKQLPPSQVLQNKQRARGGGGQDKQGY